MITYRIAFLVHNSYELQQILFIAYVIFLDVNAVILKDFFKWLKCEMTKLARKWTFMFDERLLIIDHFCYVDLEWKGERIEFLKSGSIFSVIKWFHSPIADFVWRTILCEVISDIKIGTILGISDVFIFNFYANIVIKMYISSISWVSF